MQEQTSLLLLRNTIFRIILMIILEAEYMWINIIDMYVDMWISFYDECVSVSRFKFSLGEELTVLKILNEGFNARMPVRND